MIIRKNKHPQIQNGRFHTLSIAVLSPVLPDLDLGPYPDTNDGTGITHSRHAKHTITASLIFDFFGTREKSREV